MLLPCLFESFLFVAACSFNFHIETLLTLFQTIMAIPEFFKSGSDNNLCQTLKPCDSVQLILSKQFNQFLNSLNSGSDN
jgi:hypothetical protein